MNLKQCGGHRQGILWKIASENVTQRQELLLQYMDEVQLKSTHHLEGLKKCWEYHEILSIVLKYHPLLTIISKLHSHLK